jgi:outer membrane protein assembly factor BamB
MVLGSNIKGLSADRSLHLVDTGINIGLGFKEPGTSVPMLVAYRWNEKTQAQLTSTEKHLFKARGGVFPKGTPEIIWQAVVSATNSLTVSPGAPDADHVDVNGQTVVVAYEPESEAAHRFRLAAFELENGKRRWDVILEGDRPMGGVMVSNEHALVSRWSGLTAYHLHTGTHVWSNP